MSLGLLSNNSYRRSDPNWLFKELGQRLVEVADSDLEEDINKYAHFEPFKFDPVGYIEKYLGWTPYAGMNGKTGQVEIFKAIELSLRQQYERHDYNNGKLKRDELKHWKPGDVIKTTISVDSGNGVGKTKLAAGTVSYFHDCFEPTITYCFAPNHDQIDKLLFKEIRTDRKGENQQDKPELRGRTMDGATEVKYKPNHFVLGKATNDSGGTGVERVHGQHEKHMLIVLDEAEGIPEFVWSAIGGLTTGCIAYIILVVRNPRTTTCKAHTIRERSTTASFTVSCLDSPNVVTGKHIVPGITGREWVNEKLDDEEYFQEVDRHNEDENTIEVDWRPGKIYKPVRQGYWRVLGIADSQSVVNSFCPRGRYKAATLRDEPKDSKSYLASKKASIGVDVARFGDDYGTGYTFAFGKCHRFRQFSKNDTNEYARAIKQECKRLAELGINEMSVRIDGGGGFGGGVVDKLRPDADLKAMFSKFEVLEIPFGATAYNSDKYKNIITDMYANVAEKIKDIAIINPPKKLENDLVDRRWEWVTVRNNDVKVLEIKRGKNDNANRGFYKRNKRSPDDGDGFVLAVTSDYLLNKFKLKSTSVLFWDGRL